MGGGRRLCWNARRAYEACAMRTCIPSISIMSQIGDLVGTCGENSSGLCHGPGRERESRKEPTNCVTLLASWGVFEKFQQGFRILETGRRGKRL